MVGIYCINHRGHLQFEFSERICVLFFTDHQIEYIVSLSHSFF